MRRREFLLTPGLAAPGLGLQAQPASRPLRVVIGAENDWFPYSGESLGRAEGMTVDLVAAAFAAVGVEARFDVLPYARCMALAKVGQLVACFNTTRTELIEADYLWPAKPMFEERFLIYARQDGVPARPALGVRDLEGQPVAVTRGYEYGSEFDANPRIERLVTSHDENNFRLVLRGRARYTLAPDINARLLFQRFPELAGQFKVVGGLSLFGIYTAFSRHHPESAQTLAAFDEGMRIIGANGVAKAIQERWRQRAGGR
ncbi:substrate-binding periplasmic protein [Roseateles saccharophilus]|uniref:Amino acid ABC transporter substrate-binding protein (PAAT family) n=1 Tax=Roseateles saccharophilus TaxID=304 RepID=A0A4R3VHM4_ROSSA|nr:transporter substrate-binding domain-containing protein [Roseateles saccharophilus]MDG0835531.1 transporter substrate-binding domain-containing protein [Roseateles saccharophilus]TCV03593.1 amino acid ABC transporter substrate-binding protein (PAAT family) [Roseateles saccharophilus]